MKKITKYSKENRKKMTLSEKVFKNYLLSWGIKFRSQRPFDYYIVDFLIPNKRLAIEIDGEYHNNREEYDIKRDIYLEKIGLKVIRISNDKVLKTDCEDIKKFILSFDDIKFESTDYKLLYGTAKY